jgi:hypothetical protein
MTAWGIFANNLLNVLQVVGLAYIAARFRQNGK